MTQSPTADALAAVADGIDAVLGGNWPIYTMSPADILAAIRDQMRERVKQLENDAASSEAASGDGQRGSPPVGAVERETPSPSPTISPAPAREGNPCDPHPQFGGTPALSSLKKAPTPAGAAERCSTCGGNITRTAEGVPIHTDFSCADDRRDVFAVWNRRASPTPAGAGVEGRARELAEWCQRTAIDYGNVAWRGSAAMLREIAETLLALRAEVHNVRGLFNTASATAKEEHERAKAAEGRLAQVERERDRLADELGAATREPQQLRLMTLTRRTESAEARAAKLEAIADAAIGLCHGSDWNNGNHAKRHGYRDKLRRAVFAIKPNHPNLQDLTPPQETK